MIESKMSQFNAFHFHNGHFAGEDFDKSLREVKNEHYDNIDCEEEDAADYLYTDAQVLLRGSCTLFALALHEKYGYEVYEILDDEDRLAHVFCKSSFHGQDVYIDVRGKTTDFSEIAMPFRHWLRKGYRICKRNLDEDRKMENPGDNTGYPFAKEIIERHRSLYDRSET